MTDKKVWLITGTSRGMGVEFAKAALAAGHKVVATGRNIDAVSKAVGQAEDLLIVKLDVTRPADAQAAVQSAVERFIAGADAIAVAEQKVQDLQEQIHAYRDLSASMAVEAR